MPNPPFAPPRWPQLVPRIFADDDAGLVAFIEGVFAADVDTPPHGPAQLWIGGSVLMVSGTSAERAPCSAFLYVYVPDADATYARAIAAGARSLEAPLDTPYGDRRAMVEDRWGNTWQIATYGNHS
jgi:uncharacterized glyoxalase superfamily protein PhnB